MTHTDIARVFAVSAGLVAVLAATVPIISIAALSSPPTAASVGLMPSPQLEPSDVVRIQVEALRENTPLNEGIELTYRFASPANKRSTGPLDRFLVMVRSAPYDRLLNHLSARYGPVAVSGDESSQTVIVTDKGGEEVAYVWTLSRQQEGEFEACWMTTAVIPARGSGQRHLGRTV